MDLEAIGGQGEVDPEGPAEASRDHHGDGPGDGSRGPSLDLDQGGGEPGATPEPHLETGGPGGGPRGRPGASRQAPGRACSSRSRLPW